MESKQKLLFFSILTIQFLERFAYINILVQLPIFIAQKDIPNTLGWEQEVKGWIFFVWALIQNLTPVFFGIVADRISPKKALTFSLLFVCLGYFFLTLQLTIFILLLSVILIGFGSGGFKPSIQSLLSDIPSKKIWSFYLFVNNLAFLFALLGSKFLKGISWNHVFIGSFTISLVNLFFSFYLVFKFLKKSDAEIIKLNNKAYFKELLFILLEKRMLLIIGITTCFAMIYMQFYETLPNFIVDWVDTSSIANMLSLPEAMTINTTLGRQISYELLYILNPILILLFVSFIQKISENKGIYNPLIFAQIFVILGFALCGFTMFGSLFLLGMVIYTFGEMLFNIKILETISKVAPAGKKASYFGALNISYTIGLTTGALSGGYLYKHLAEKYTLAKNFLKDNFSVIPTSEPLSKIQELINVDAVSSMLWSYYKPYIFWIPFLVIGAFGIILTFVSKKYNSI